MLNQNVLAAPWRRLDDFRGEGAAPTKIHHGEATDPTKVHRGEGTDPTKVFRGEGAAPTRGEAC